MSIKIPLLILSLFIVRMSYSQNTDTAKKNPADSTVATPPPVALSGSVDIYYRYNVNAPSGKNNNYTSFTNSQNSFELGMASIRADHSFGKVSATADLGFGRRAEEFSYNDAAHPTLFAVKQAYLSYQASAAIKITAGKWGTHIGYEVVDAFVNRNYSMDYMFSYGPFFHTGLKADITLNSTTAFMAGIANPTDFSTTSSGTKVAIAQFSTGTANGQWKFFLNYQGYGGVAADTALAPGYTLFKNLNQFDLIVNGTLSPQFGIGFNATLQAVNSSALGKSANWWGSALYLNYDPVARFGLTLRGEYFSDPDGLRLNTLDPANESPGSSVFDLTLSLNWKPAKNLTLIPELRMDNSSKSLFYNQDGGFSKSTGSALVAAVYHF